MPVMAPDPRVPQRDLLLDAPRLAGRLDQLLGWPGPAGVERVSRVRVKYRVGRGVGLVLRVQAGRRTFLVSARSFPRGQGLPNYERGLAALPQHIVGLRPVSFAPELETVFWTFPHDRRIESLELLCGPGEELATLVGTRCIPELAAYVPEKAATARCLGADGASMAYVKVYAPGRHDPGGRSYALLRLLHAATARTRTRLRIPRPLAYDPSRRALVVEAIAGEPMVVGNLDASPPGLAGLGAALATLHCLPPPPELPRFERLDLHRLREAAELIGSVRPDVAVAAAELAGVLATGIEDDGDQVWLHGDPHGKNALSDAGAVALLDLDQTARGPAPADLGSVLAGLSYLRCTGLIPAAYEQALATDFLDGYQSVRDLPDGRTLAWFTAAALLGERAVRAVTRVRPEGLSHLGEVLEAGRRTYPAPTGSVAPHRPRTWAARKPPLLLYCQHAVGLGHLTRSLALAGALADRFDVVLLSGGTVPAHVTPPRGVEVIQLPPLIMREGGGLLSPDGRRTVERAKLLRARMLTEAVRVRRPAVLLVELFPFGRRAFAGEIVAMLEAAQAMPGDPPLVACSLRDILVGRGGEQASYDDRACALANAYFDAILVHSDPRFARLEESFRPRTPLRVPVHYTGFVSAAPRAAAPPDPALRRVVVSAGGGRVGEPLLQAAIDAQARLRDQTRLTMRLIAGPFLSEEAWRRIRRRARGIRGLELYRAVGDLSAELALAGASISQCGYNTALEVLQARIPALVVPYLAPGEDEQMRRAKRLQALDAVRMLDPRDCTGPALAEQIEALLGSTPLDVQLDLGGAKASAELLWQRLGIHAAAQAQAVTA
jgi:predicted glycosyltransferase/aminoglycoside phosphotransferase (APT) family kinase protein